MKVNSKIIFCVVAIVLFVLTLVIYPDYGITGDADTQNTYGHYVWDYISNFGEPLKPFEKYHPGHDELKYYGGLFDGLATMTIDVFKLSNDFTARHFLNALLGLLAILYSGLIVHHITKNWLWATLGMIFVTLTPRFFGEMFNNPKDIPFAAGYIISIFFILKFMSEFEKPKWNTVIGLVIGIAISVGVRIGGVLVIAYFGLLYIMTAWLSFKFKFQSFKLSLVRAFIAVSVGYLLAIFWWPYAHGNIFSNPMEALSIMSNYPLSISMLFDGMRVNTAELPTNYLFRWIWIGTPVFILIGLVFGFIYATIEIVKSRSVDFFILLLALVFPVFYIVYKKSVVYDGLRHIIFILPLMSILACFGYYKVYIQFKGIPKYVTLVLMIVLMLLPIKHMIVNHPNQYVYFNEIFGGVNKAFGYYETDYYHNSGKLASDWVKENILKNSTSKVKILSNMSTQYLYYQKMDTSKVFASYGRWRERDHLDWDYYIAYSRFIEPENLQNGAWPPGKIVYRINVDEIPVCVIMQRQNKDDIQAYEALNKGDMINAAALYQKNLSKDNSNEYTWYYYSIVLANSNRIEEAINALKTAIQLNSSNPEWVEQLQKYYQMYASKKA